jgi:hypothetical protein
MGERAPYCAIQFVDFACISTCDLLTLLSGDEGTRTPDFCLAKAALSQLSYIPETTDLTMPLGLSLGPR